mgnify:CR=1 FL=1
MRNLCRSVSALFAGIFVLAASIHVASAQEESVKPGINDGYKNADVERTVKRFEGEKRDVVAKRNEIIDACQLKPGMMVADIGAGTGLIFILRWFWWRVNASAELAVAATPNPCQYW